jgi:hypothetical protein
MNIFLSLWRGLLALALCIGLSATAQETPRSGSWVVKDFKFHTGEVLPELRLNYTTLGDPKNEAVLILHGTTGSGAGMLGAAFGGELFGPGQILDAKRYFVTRLAPASPASLQTVCGPSSRPTTTTTWSRPNTDWSQSTWAFGTCAWSWATPWAACKPGCGP